MTPLLFGTSARRLFGIYEPAHGAGHVQRAVVLCQPWGQEYLRAHRSMRRLANMLATAGCHTLRFDYFGTGDSAGEMHEADLAGWEKDLEWAIDEIKDTSGAAKVALVGLRLGATLATRVAARRAKDVHALVLWDPVVRGEDFLDEVLALETAIASAEPEVRPDVLGGGHEVLGFPVTAAMAAQLKSLDILALTNGLPDRTLTLVSQPGPSHEALASSLASRSAGSLPLEILSGLPAWLEDRHTGAGAIPVNALQRITRWLA